MVFHLIMASLKFYYQNVRGICTKTLDIYVNSSILDYDVIILSETWLRSDILDSELFDNNFSVYRRDRRSSGFHGNKSGGGVLIAVSKKFSSCRLSNYESMCEDVWVGVDICLGKKPVKLKICGVYLPSPIKEHILTTFIDNTCQVLENDGPSLIVGDFNLGKISWTPRDSSYLNGSSSSNSKLNNILLDFISFSHLNQYNYIKNHNDVILDLVLSDLELTGLNRCAAPLSNIDPHHPPLHFNILSDYSSPSFPNNIIYKFNFFKADYNKIIEHLKKVDWHEVFSNIDNVDQMLDIFYNILHETITTYVPKSRLATNRHPVWFDRD
jgi:hypothetical protein